MKLRRKYDEQSLSRQLGKINRCLTNILDEGIEEYQKPACQSELKVLAELFIELYKRSRAKEIEAEERYQQLRVSYIELEERYAQSYTFRFVQEQISRELNSQELLTKTLDVVMGVFGSRRSLIYMVDEVKNALVLKAGMGYKDSAEYRDELPCTEDNYFVQTFKDRKVFCVMINGSGGGPNSQYQLMMVPLDARHRCLGLMVLEIDIHRTINDDLMEFAQSIAKELSLSLENAYLYDTMRNMAIRDALTGVYNRMYLMDYMAELFIKRPQNVAVIILDLDHFKQINDRFGHLNGDQVLKTATRLIEGLLQDGILARYGGEEFVIVLPDYNQRAAFNLGEQIRVAIEAHCFLTPDRQRMPVTVSVGLASYPLEAEQYEELLQLADQALYKAKNSGRNRLCIP